MSVATWQVGDGTASAKITVTPLGGAAGGVPANVNRWRRQVGLGQAAEGDVNSMVEPLEVGDEIELTLEFAEAGATTVTVEVRESAP